MQAAVKQLVKDVQEKETEMNEFKFISYAECRAKMIPLLAGESEEVIVERCQRMGFEQGSRKALAVDGKAGLKTHGGAYVDPAWLETTPNLRVAFGELLKGSQEVGGNNMGPFVRTYFRLKKDPAKNAGPFCAGGASYCLDQGYPEDDTPYIVGAQRLGKAVAKEGSMKRQLKLAEMQPGDLAIWERITENAGTGHVATTVLLLPNQSLLTIDFNGGSAPSPTRLFISAPGGAINSGKFLFGARWK